MQQDKSAQLGTKPERFAKFVIGPNSATIEADYGQRRAKHGLGYLKRERAMTILQDVGSESAMLRELGELRAENERLKARAVARGLSRLTCKVSKAGAVSVYGMGRWPVTLYAEQWGKIKAFMPEITAFIEDNASMLSSKDDNKPE